MSDSHLLAFFHNKFPQSLPWKLSQLCTPMLSALTWALSTNGSKLALPHNVPRQWKTIGHGGMHSAWNTMLTRISERGRTPSPCSKSSPNGNAMDAWLPARKPRELTLWRTQYAQWHRRTSDWGPLTRVKTPTEA
jgi:hypothetical protein